MSKISAKLKRGHSNGDAKCRWGKLDAGAVAYLQIGDFRREALLT